MTFFVSCVWSQEAKLTEKEVRVLRDDANKALGRLAHREKMTTVTYDAKLKVTQTYSFFKEFLPPDRSHFIFDSKTPAGILRSESIIIGKKGYSKVGNEPWKRDSVAVRESGLDTLADWDLDSYGVSRQTVTVVRRTDELPGKLITNLYEITTSQKFNKGIRSNENIYVSRYWFDQEGRMVKAERESTSTNSKSAGRRTSIYEYDPNISIQAPIK